MNIFDSFILGLLQGITEFLPISSSGHLVLGEHYLGLKVETLKSFDVVVHVGTLLAILIYFRKDIFEMLKAVGRFLIGKLKFSDPYAQLIIFIIIGTIPAVFVGLFLEDYIDLQFRNLKSVGFFMMLIGVLFITGEYTFKRLYAEKSLKEKLIYKADKLRDVVTPGGYESNEIRGMKWYKALIIGIAQAIAIIPGISRSGSTIVAGLFQGIDRSAAARFSFLLGVPAIAGAGILTAIKIETAGSLEVAAIPLLVGFLSSFVFGLLSISFLMKFLKRNTLIIFSIYLIALGFSVFI